MAANSMRNIVIVNDNAKVTGGADKVALASARGLAERGFSVYLLTAAGPVASELLDTPGLQVICTGQYEILHDPNRPRAAVQGLWNVSSWRLAKQLFDSLDPQATVVHLHLWAKALSSSVIRAALDRGFQIVCTLHDYLLACPAGTFFDHQRRAICTRRPMSTECLAANCDSRSYADKLWRVLRQAVQCSAGHLPRGLTDVIAISELVSSVMRPYLPSTARVHCVSNFVEIDKPSPAQVELNRKFVFVGRLVAEKGPVLFAEASRSTGIPALFLGEGNCRALIREANPEAEISGWLSSAQTAERLRSARALVFPSVWYEAQPLVVLEALAQGVPCIVADTSAGAEMIVDKTTGLLFRGGDGVDLQSQIIKMLDDEYARAMGRAAYDAYWAAPRTLDRHLDELSQVYETMLSAAPRRMRA